MVLVLYSRDGRPLHRVARRLAAAIAEQTGARCDLAPESDPPEDLSCYSAVVAVWWHAAVPILDRLPDGVPLILMVFDHESWLPAWNHFADAAARATLITAGHRALAGEVSAACGKPVVVVRDGVDCEAFTPATTQRAAGPLRVGWAGDSSNANKRLAMLRSAVAAIEGVELVVADLARTGHPEWAQMPDFWRSVDVVADVSLHAGTPCPVLEAAACGVPYLSTAVGLVPEIHGLASGGVVIRWEREDVVNGLRWCLANRALLPSIGARLRSVVVGQYAWADRGRWEPVLKALGSVGARPDTLTATDGRPLVLLIADVRGWAFDRNLRDLADALKDSFRFDLWHMADQTPGRLHPPFHRYDAIVPLYHLWGIENDLPYGRTIGALCAQYLWLDKQRPAGPEEWEHVNRYAGYWVVNRRSLEEYREHCPRVVYLTNPVKMERHPHTAETWDAVLPCWAGNSHRICGTERDPKGFAAIIRPACQDAGLTLAVADYHERRIPADEMPDWYCRSNTYVDASSHEGASNAVMEAMASGLILVTAGAGNAPELYESQIKHFGESGVVLARDRSREAFADALARLALLTPDQRKRMGEINRQEISERWSWETWADGYESLILGVCDGGH